MILVLMVSIILLMSMPRAALVKLVEAVVRGEVKGSLVLKVLLPVIIVLLPLLKAPMLEILLLLLRKFLLLINLLVHEVEINLAVFLLVVCPLLHHHHHLLHHLVLHHQLNKEI